MHLLDIIEIGQICYIYFYVWEKRPWPWNVSDFFPIDAFRTYREECYNADTSSYAKSREVLKPRDWMQ